MFVLIFFLKLSIVFSKDFQVLPNWCLHFCMERLAK